MTPTQEITINERAVKLATRVVSENLAFLTIDQKSFQQAALRAAVPLLQKGVAEQEIGRAIRDAAQISMLPGKHVYLIPFENQAAEFGRYSITLIMSFRGVLEKINAIEGCRCYAPRIVFANDDFDCSYATGSDGYAATVRHKPALADKGAPLAVYCVYSRGGVEDIVLLDRDYLEQVKAFAIARAKGKSTPWAGPWELEMWKKTAVLRAAKYFPFGLPDLKIEGQADDATIEPIDVPAEVEAPDPLPKPKSKRGRARKAEPDVSDAEFEQMVSDDIEPEAAAPEPDPAPASEPALAGAAQGRQPRTF